MIVRGQTAVVTGSGGTGCGRAIAVRLAREGAAVVVSDVNETGGRETVRLIQDDGGRAAFLRTDVRDERQVADLIAFAGRTFDGVTMLVNNASGPFHPGHETEYWTETVETELLGTMYGVRYAIDAMRRGSGGAIVNIASISGLWHGRRTPGGASGYDTAKAGVIRLTTSLASLAETDRIRVNCLAPGWIATDGPRQYWESLTVEERRERRVPARLLSPADVATAVVSLLTDETLAGRVLLWWSEDAPRLIAFGDPGYRRAEDFPFASPPEDLRRV